MKFGDYLHESAIPEWKDKYIHYNVGKKKLDAFKLKLKKQEALHTSEPLTEPLTRDYFPSATPRIQLRTDSSVFSSVSSLDTLENYTHSQTDFINDFINRWLLTYEVNKCNHFYLWLLEQCKERFIVLKHQMEMYNKQLERESDLSTAALLAMCHRNKKQLGQNSYGSLTSLLSLARERNESSAESVMTSISDLSPSFKFKDFLKQNNLLPSWPKKFRLLHSHISNKLLNSDKHSSGITIGKARKLMDDVILEFYLYIQLVRTFRDLNATGFRKIVKKFDKVCGTRELSSLLKMVRTKYTIFEHGDMNIQVLEQAKYSYSKPLTQLPLTDENNQQRIDPLLVWEQKVNTWYTTDLLHTIAEKKRRTERIKKLSLEYRVSERTIHRSNRSILQMFVGGLGVGFCIPITCYIYYILQHSPTTSYLHTMLLPLWGSWFLFFLLSFFYLFDCFIWHRTGINYRFIMFGEIHQRNGAHLFNNDFSTSLISLHFYFTTFFAVPCAIFAIMSFYNTDIFPYAYTYLVSIFILFLFPNGLIPYWDKLVESRKWLIVGIIRLVFSGLFPVEFGDFFLGVLFCSLTYSLSEIAIFFCISLGTTDGSCSTSSWKVVLLFSCLPNFWRFLQCLRRLADSGDSFPHLPNAAKYAMGVAFNASFCIYRVSNHNKGTKRYFILFAAINAIFTTIWDLVMDWSLFQSSSKNLFLRDDLYLAGSRNWKTGEYSLLRRCLYYACMLIDVTIRFQWLIYVYAPISIQDSGITTFVLALTELMRRIIWIVFRVENEHVANVQLFKVTGETTLPYPTISIREAIEELDDESQAQFNESDYQISDVSTWAPQNDKNLNIKGIKSRRGSMLENISKNISWAHTSDFQRPRVFSTILQNDNSDGDNDV